MLLINYLKRNLNKTIYNYFFILQLASVIAKIIDKKPTINFKVISSLSIKEPSKIADRGLNPREIAAWVGEINWSAFPQQYIIKTPPGMTNINNA